MFQDLMRFTDPGAREMPADLSTVSCDLAEAKLGAGHITSYRTRSGIVTILDAKLDHDLSYQAEVTTDLLLVRAAVSTNCSYAPSGTTPWLFRMPEVTISTIPRGTTLDVRIGSGGHQCALTVLIERRALFEGHDIVAADLPPPLRHFIEDGGELAAMEASLPMRPEIASLVDDLRHSRLTGGLRKMQLEGRATELLALAASTWKSRSSSEQGQALRGRDAELLANARRILLERCTERPKVQDVASALGTNRTKISQLFRDCIGVTPHEYALHRRIERAQALIVEGKLNLGQVADAVGYQHQSSFTTAFREVTGMSPREFANQARQQVNEAKAALH